MAGKLPTSSRPVTLRLLTGCNLAETRTAVQTIRDFLAQQGWVNEDLMSIELALVEGCNNAFKYAGESGRGKPLGLEAISEATQVEFRIYDHTPGFDWPEKIELPEPDSESGRGLYLINSVMDYAGYFRGRDENILIMRKRRAAAAPVVEAPDATAAGRKLMENERVISDLVEELSSCYESLSAIFRYSNDPGKSGNLKQFAQRLFTDLLQIISADWFVLKLVSRENLQLVVFAASAPALELSPILFPTAGEPAHSMEIEAALTRQPVWFDSGSAMATDGPLFYAKPESAGVVQPIVLGDRLVGTVILGRTGGLKPGAAKADSVFTAAQLSVINTLTEFLAIQIANMNFQEEEVRRRLVSRELEIANNIQLSLLPKSLPQIPGFTLAAFCRSAHEVGGDFFDTIRIDEDNLLLVIADVMGKGIPAALFAAILRTLLRAAPELTQQPSALMTRVNRLLYPELSGVDMFITAQLAFVDAKAGKMVVASAGHCPLIVASAAGVKTFSPEGMPLGILPDAKYDDETVDLPVDGRVLMYTDGLTDALNATGEFFGQQRLLEWLEQPTARHGTAEQLKEDLTAQLKSYQSQAALNDDQTFLIMVGQP